MRKLGVVTAAAAIALAGTAAVAQPGGPGGNRKHAHSVESVDGAYRAALLDAKVGAIQAGLKLTDAQKQLWEPVEKAMRDHTAARWAALEARRDRKDGERPDFMQRFELGADRMNEGARHMTAMAEAMKPFWASLDDTQRKLLPVLMHQGEGRWKRGYGHHKNRREHLEGRGLGQGEHRL